jgi:hypothetical protein
VSIILKESDDTAKYELFQRLNTGGSQLSDQEVRNSILVMMNPDFYRWLKGLSDDEAFRETVGVSDRAIEQQYDVELVLRFVALRAMAPDDLTKLRDLGEFLTDKATQLAADKAFDYKTEEGAFKTTFSQLRKALGSDAFRRYDSAKNRFSGGFSLSSFEAVALGLGYNVKVAKLTDADIIGRVQSIWSNPDFLDNSGMGVSASSRVPKIVPFGRTLFSK